ncbi:unnamed protein product, partial [Medioppia subpectinata]
MCFSTIFAICLSHLANSVSVLVSRIVSISCPHYCHNCEPFESCELFRNTEFYIAGTDCGKKCADRLNAKTLSYCDLNVRKPGCYCKTGYFRDWSYNCVRGNQCDKGRPAKGGKS